MIDHDRQRIDVQFKLDEALIEEPKMLDRNTGIRKDAILKVHVVDAVNLEVGDSDTTTVRCLQGGTMAETQPAQGSGPIYNEAILFDITKETPLTVGLLDD